MATAAPPAQIRSARAGAPSRSPMLPQTSAAGTDVSCWAIVTAPMSSPENPSPRKYGAKYDNHVPTPA